MPRFIDPFDQFRQKKEIEKTQGLLRSGKTAKKLGGTPQERPSSGKLKSDKSPVEKKEPASAFPKEKTKVRANRNIDPFDDFRKQREHKELEEDIKKEAEEKKTKTGKETSTFDGFHISTFFKNKDKQSL